MTDPALPPRFPSALEIVGIVAGAAPFVVSFASSSWSTVNGEIASFTYRDPAAISWNITPNEK